MNRWFGRSVLLATLILSGVTTFAQKRDREMTCNDNWQSDRLVGHCEIQEQILAPGGVITVDARKNGGIAVRGWDRNEIGMRAKVQAAALTQSEAEALARQIRIQTAGLKIFADGPEMTNNANWSVSYELNVPRRSDVSLETHNGGIVISDVSGRLEFSALNGGVVLKHVAGSVKGSTTNGGLVVELSGDRWEGDGLDVKTTNGGVVMSVPDNYSAHLETGTVNGNLSVDFPVTVQGKITKELAMNLGAGGATVRARTTNGGVKIKRTSFSN